MEPIIPLTIGVLASLGAEAYLLAEWRNKVPIRIHVNGTRGKSTTVRLIAAMCRKAGASCIAKFTGGAPGWIDTAGVEHIWVRRGPARLSEQMRFWRLAARQGVQTAVLECMAVDPYLQWVAERRITKATHTVITNVRLDHQEVMGADLTQIACSLANAVPVNGHLILGAEEFVHVFAPIAASRNTRLSWVTAEMRQELRQELGGDWSAGFLENAATALLAAETLGISAQAGREVLQGWQRETPYYPALWQRRIVWVINGLAANDPESACMLWDRLPSGEKAVALYAHRADRPLRLRGFLKALEQETRCRELLITGPIAKQHETLRQWQAEAGDRTPWAVSAVGTQAVTRRITALTQQSATPIWLILLGNELGLPPECRTFVTPVTEYAEAKDAT